MTYLNFVTNGQIQRKLQPKKQNKGRNESEQVEKQSVFGSRRMKKYNLFSINRQTNKLKCSNVNRDKGYKQFL